MQQYLRVLAFSLLTGSSLALFACEEEGSTPQPTPPPTTPQSQKAALTGQIQPAGAVTRVTATDAAGVSLSATPTSSGAYSFPQAVVGTTYTLSFTPASDYTAPANQSVTLTAGGTTVPTTTVAPVPATATLSGQLSPAGSITAVTATTASGQATTATPTGSGAYAFANLPLGVYTLTFTPASGYTAPAAMPVTLTAGGTTAPPVTSALASSSASFSVNGVPVSVLYRSSLITADRRSLTFSVQPGGAPGHTLSLTVGERVPIAGTYALNSYDYNAEYFSPNWVSYYSDQFAQGRSDSGTITITVNAALRRYSGTFSFTGRDPESSAPNGSLPPGTPPTVTITGSFDNFTY